MKPYNRTTTIAKSFTFDAAHALPRMPEGHKCKRMHGHTWEVEIVLAGLPDDNGIVLDYDVFDAMWAPLAADLDHYTLNDVDGLDDTPTTEVIAAWIADRIQPQLRAIPRASFFAAAWIRVRESSSTWAEVKIRL